MTVLRTRTSTATRTLRTLLLASLASLLPPAAPGAAANVEPVESWREVIRRTPYWQSQGVAANLATIRRWVLMGESYCAEPERHLLFDRRARFLGYIDNGASPEETIARLNDTRQRLANEGRAEHWSPGETDGIGYPFALACHQPFVDIHEAIARLTGGSEEYRVWGTWDGMSVGAPSDQLSLVELFRIVFEHRHAQGRFTFPDTVMPTFLGKVIVESGGIKDALSPYAAMGIMQLRPAVLDDCGIPKGYRLHRMAQVDCALMLVEQNHRNLRAPFEEVFGHLPQEKREKLYGLLLTQAYQIGVGRAIELLRDEELGKAARYFAENHERFGVEDILVGMIFHNMGRRDIGLRSLYYVTDAGIARGVLCRGIMRDDSLCGE